MRIGLLAWSYPPEKSGLAHAAREIAEALSGAGHDVRVLTLDRMGRSEVGGVTVIGCAPSRVAARLRRLPALGHLVAPALFARAAARAHRERAFDIVEATNWYAPALFVGRLAPVVIRNSTPVATSAASATGMLARLDAAAARVVERIAARRATAHISNTAAHGHKIAALYGVAPPGPRHAVIGLSSPPGIVARGGAATYPEDNGPVRLLFVGRAERRKGFDALLDALGLLAARAPFEALLIGVAEADLAGLPPAARAMVEARHRVPEPVLHDAFAAAHVVVAPSRYESFGLVYQEAMAFGRPILACAEDPSARLFVGETGAGVLARRCTGAEIATAMELLIRDRGLRARLAVASRTAAGRFDRGTLARETIAVYSAARGGPR